MDTNDMDEAAANAEIDRMVDEYRIRCLWFIRPDFYPTTREERLRILSYIERHGDRQAFLRAGTLRQWFSQNSNETSAGS